MRSTFFSYLLRNLEIGDVKLVLCTDSQGCIQVSKDLAKHWKLKHIDTWYYTDPIEICGKRPLPLFLLRSVIETFYDFSHLNM